MEVVNIIIFVSSFSWDSPGVSGADSAPRAHPQGGGACQSSLPDSHRLGIQPLGCKGAMLGNQIGRKM